MLKPRYVIIIILMVFIVITVLGFTFEQVFVERSARNAYIYTATAAECALKNATMSDEFFTSGVTRDGSASKAATINGRDVNTASAASGLLVDTGYNTFQRTNVFLWTYNINRGNAVAAATDAYETMYSSSDFQNWATKILDMSTGIHSQNSSRQVFWSDELIYSDFPGQAPTLHFASGTTRIPKLLTMGGKLFVDELGYDPDTLLSAMSSTSKVTSDNKKEHFYGTSATSVAYNIGSRSKLGNVLGAADYWDYVRSSSITLNSDNWYTGAENVTFFYTPTSLGLTYLDQNILDVFFRSNLDLLMRAQYIDTVIGGADGLATLSPEYKAWFGNEDGVNYGSDVSSTWGQYAVNNGVFYYLRGKPTRMGNSISYLDPSGMEYKKPDIEYMYITLSRDDLSKMSSSEKAAWNNVLVRAVSPITTIDKLVNTHTATNGERYELCIARVSFYADFFVPYSTAPMRGMAKNFGTTDGDLNESNLRGLEVSEELIDSTSSLLLNNKPITSFRTEDSAIEGSQQLVYTTYYAIVD